MLIQLKMRKVISNRIEIKRTFIKSIFLIRNRRDCPNLVKTFLPYFVQ